MKFIIKYTILYLVMTISTVFACPHDKETMINIQDNDKLESLLKNNMGPSLIYFYSDNCGWCSKMKPIVEKLADDDQFCNMITFYKVNGPHTKAQDLILTYLNKKIPGYPTLLLINQGKVIETQIGGTTESIVRNKLVNLMKRL